MAAELFDDLTDVYDATIDWPRRLGNEEPFYRWLVQRTGAARVLDAACGTGRHAFMLQAWGLSVEAADLSPGMIERCRRSHGEHERLRWVVRPFDQPATPEAFDLAICVGNSLALAPDRATVGRALRNLLAAVRRGGIVVAHVVNVFALPEGRPVWQKCVRARLEQGDCLIIKGIHRCGNAGFVDLLVTPLDAQGPKLKADCVPFLGLAAAELERLAREAGATAVEVYGSYQRGPHLSDRSTDIIVLCEK